MSRPPPPDDLSVHERSRYSSATGGPTSDADVHTRATPNLPYTAAEPSFARDPRLSGSDLITADLRQNLRAPSEVHRRTMRLPSWWPYAAFALVFSAAMVAGVVGVLAITRRPTEGPPAPPPPPEELGGVPVREGLRNPNP